MGIGLKRVGLALVTVAVATAVACGDVNAALERIAEARRLSADLVIQFTKAADAANRAVMADTDETSVTFAREAEQATQAIQRDADTLAPLLKTLEYSNETRLLEDFGRRFAEYRALDRTILELAVENTNLKAQQLSFGAAQEAADACQDALQAAVARDASETWHVKALVATAVASVREIQVLQAPRIAEADEVAMTRLEKRMTAAEASAREAVATLAILVNATSRPKVTAATAALDRLVSLNAQIRDLSRRNTNVRSLALSLGQKRMLTVACEASLHALRDALSKRGFTGTR